MHKQARNWSLLLHKCLVANQQEVRRKVFALDEKTQLSRAKTYPIPKYECWFLRRDFFGVAYPTIPIELGNKTPTMTQTTKSISWDIMGYLGFAPPRRGTRWPPGLLQFYTFLVGIRINFHFPIVTWKVDHPNLCSLKYGLFFDSIPFVVQISDR